MTVLKPLSAEMRAEAVEWQRMALSEAGLHHIAEGIEAVSDSYALRHPGTSMLFPPGSMAVYAVEVNRARALRHLKVKGPDHATVCAFHNTGDRDLWSSCRLVRVSDLLLGFSCEQRPAWNGGEP